MCHNGSNFADQDSRCYRDCRRRLSGVFWPSPSTTKSGRLATNCPSRHRHRHRYRRIYLLVPSPAPDWPLPSSLLLEAVGFRAASHDCRCRRWPHGHLHCISVYQSRPLVGHIPQPIVGTCSSLRLSPTSHFPDRFRPLFTLLTPPTCSLQTSSPDLTPPLSGFPLAPRPH